LARRVTGPSSAPRPSRMQFSCRAGWP
jgi:hypothetical protein